MSKDKLKARSEEIDRLDTLLAGFSMYLSDIDKDLSPDTMKVLNDNSLFDLRKRNRMSEDEIVKRLSNLLERVRAEAVEQGIDLADITDEKLLGYYQMNDLEMDQISDEISQRVAKGEDLGRASAEIKARGPKLH